jgi:hypothetical protein
MCDDDGRIEGNHETVTRFGGFREDSREIASALDELRSLRRVVLYEVEGNPFIHLPLFVKHQKIDRPTPSKLPPPPGLTEDSRIVANLLESSTSRARARGPDPGPDTDTDPEGGSGGKPTDAPRIARPEEFEALRPFVKAAFSQTAFPALWEGFRFHGLFIAHWNDTPSAAFRQALEDYARKGREPYTLNSFIGFLNTAKNNPREPAKPKPGEYVKPKGIAATDEQKARKAAREAALFKREKSA